MGKIERLANQIEKSLSNLGSDDKRTTTFYRNKQKRQAFEIMANAAAKYNIHDTIISYGKAEYSRYRDVREHVHDFEACVAACIILGFETTLLVGQLQDATRGLDNKHTVAQR